VLGISVLICYRKANVPEAPAILMCREAREGCMAAVFESWKDLLLFIAARIRETENAIGWREKCTLTSLFLVLVAWGLEIVDVGDAILVEPKIKALTLKPRGGPVSQGVQVSPEGYSANAH